LEEWVLIDSDVSIVTTDERARADRRRAYRQASRKAGTISVPPPPICPSPKRRVTADSILACVAAPTPVRQCDVLPVKQHHSLKLISRVCLSRR